MKNLKKNQKQKEEELRADDVCRELLVVSTDEGNQFPSPSHDVVDVAVCFEVDAFFDPYGERDEGVAVQVFSVLSDGDDLAANPGMVSGAQLVGALELYRVSHGESLPALHHPHFRVVERASDDRVVSEDTLVHTEPPRVLGFGMCDRVEMTRLLRCVKDSTPLLSCQGQQKISISADFLLINIGYSSSSASESCPISSEVLS